MKSRFSAVLSALSTIYPCSVVYPTGYVGNLRTHNIQLLQANSPIIGSDYAIWHSPLSIKSRRCALVAEASPLIRKKLYFVVDCTLLGFTFGYTARQLAS